MRLTMQAILLKSPGGAEQLEWGEFPTPVPQKNEILIRVKAASLNRADILQREGKYPPPPGASPILGLDVSGLVAATGPECEKFKKGDSVMALLAGGGYAEFAAVDERLAMPVPQHFSFEEAAALPEVFLTAYQVLFNLGHLQSGQSVLIHAGASGVGTAAIQLAEALAHATIFITAGSEEKIEFCKKLGAREGFNYKQGPWQDWLLDQTQKKGVDLILDFVGAPYWNQNLKSLKAGGKLILIAAQGGFKVEDFNMLPFFTKHLQVMGTTLRSRTNDYKAQLVADFSKEALPLFNDKKLKAIVYKVFNGKEVQDAHRCMESNQNIGKIVLKIS